MSTVVEKAEEGPKTLPALVRAGTNSGNGALVTKVEAPEAPVAYGPRYKGDGTYELVKLVKLPKRHDSDESDYDYDEEDW